MELLKLGEHAKVGMDALKGSNATISAEAGTRYRQN